MGIQTHSQIHSQKKIIYFHVLDISKHCIDEFRVNSKRNHPECPVVLTSPIDIFFPIFCVLELVTRILHLFHVYFRKPQLYFRNHDSILENLIIFQNSKLNQKCISEIIIQFQKTSIVFQKISIV